MLAYRRPLPNRNAESGDFSKGRKSFATFAAIAQRLRTDRPIRHALSGIVQACRECTTRADASAAHHGVGGFCASMLAVLATAYGTLAL